MSRTLLSLIVAIAILAPTQLRAAEIVTSDGLSPKHAQKYEQMVARAIAFLKSSRSAADGSYSSFAGIGPTALAVTGILRHGRSPDDPLVATSLKYLERHVQPDGGIHQTGTLFRNYETCVAILCFTEANADGRYDKLLQRANAFVKGLQWDEGEDKARHDYEYGGAGYGKHGRPDLSNTSFLVDALHAINDEDNTQALERAMVFVSRCQRFESEHNTTPYIGEEPDGGYYYTCAAGGESKVESSDAGGSLRSYGSMTYAGLKSMLYAGVSVKDPRVKAAKKWLRKNYTLRSNPGLGDAGLYYYYHVFAKTMHALQEDVFVDDAAKKHFWRAELIDELAKRQQSNGSWINENARWHEGDPNLVTAYSLLALSHCRPDTVKLDELGILRGGAAEKKQ